MVMVSFKLSTEQKRERRKRRLVKNSKAEADAVEVNLRSANTANTPRLNSNGFRGSILR